jgi:phosphopantetheinyl transferase (holo-ACP synthase)
MTKPKILEVDAQTGEEVLRDFNAEELAQNQLDVAQNQAHQAQELAAFNAKKEAAAKLVALGIDPKALGLDIEIPVA